MNEQEFSDCCKKAGLMCLGNTSVKYWALGRDEREICEWHRSTIGVVEGFRTICYQGRWEARYTQLQKMDPKSATVQEVEQLILVAIDSYRKAVIVARIKNVETELEILD